MSDLAKHDVHGHVRTLRTEAAEWDRDHERWHPPKSRSSITFRADGTVSSADCGNADGSVSRFSYLYDEGDRLTEIQFRTKDLPLHRTLYEYDESGRHVRTVEIKPDGSRRESEACRYEAAGGKKKVRFLDLDMPNAACMSAVEGSEIGHTANGATKMTTIYDRSGLPTEAHFHDASDRLLQRIVLTRDDAGRMVTEEVRLHGQVPFTACTHGCATQSAASEQGVESLSPEDRAKIEAMLKALMGPTDLLSKTTYSYDEKSRLLERNTGMLGLGGNRSTFRYDENDNPIATTEEDGSGGPKRDFRMQYQNDAWGNWTERVVSRQETDGHLQPSHVERREITYWDP